MILANGTKVVVTGGHYKDLNYTGTILAHRNSTRDGDSYIIEFGYPVGKVQIKAKFVRDACRQEIEPTEVVSTHHPLEGKWVIAPRGIKVFEESEAEESFLVLSRHNNRKCVLITLVYEDYGTTVANVVFQGQYAVVPLESLNVDDPSSSGGSA